MQDLQQTLMLILDYIRGIWIKKRFIIVSSWIICPIGFLYVASLPDTYRSSAVVYVDTRSVLQPLLRGLAIQTDPQAEIEMMAKTLLSRSNVEKIARESDLDLTTSTDEQFDALVTGLSKNIRLASTQRDNIYTISYNNKTPATAQTVVQETLDLFVEGALGNNRKDTDTAERFLEQQIAEYESRLTEAEQRLADFKREHNDLIPLSGSFYSQLQAANSQLEATQLEIRRTQRQVDSLKEQLKSGVNPEAFDVASGQSPLRTRYDDRIRNLEEELDRLMLRFTDQHPDVIETSQLLKSLQDARQKEIDAFLDTDDQGTAGMSQLNQQLTLEISRLESQIASMRVQEQDIVAKKADLESKIDLIPQIEAESTALNRDYSINKRKYEELLQRREQANIARSADVSAEDLQFRIIEPPLLPTKPSGPQRAIMYTGILVVGFGVGIALAFLLSQLSPVLMRPKQLETIADYPVWGAVSHFDKAAIRKRNRMRLFVFILSSGLVIGIYGVFMAAEMMNVKLLQGIL